MSIVLQIQAEYIRLSSRLSFESVQIGGLERTETLVFPTV